MQDVSQAGRLSALSSTGLAMSSAAIAFWFPLSPPEVIVVASTTMIVFPESTGYSNCWHLDYTGAQGSETRPSDNFEDLSYLHQLS